MERRPELPLAVSCFEQKHTGTFASLLHESSLRKTRKCPVRGGTHQIGEPTTKPGHVHGRRSWALFFLKNCSLTKGRASASLFYFYCSWTELSPAPQQGPSVTDHMSKWPLPTTPVPSGASPSRRRADVDLRAWKWSLAGKDHRKTVSRVRDMLSYPPGTPKEEKAKPWHDAETYPPSEV